MTKTPETIMQDWYKTKLGSREMICDEVVLDIIKAAMNAKMPTSDEVDSYLRSNRADIETIISKACDAGFKSGVKWLQERLGLK